MTTTYGTLSVAVGFPCEVELVRYGGSSPADSGFVAARQFRRNVSRQSGKAETRVWRFTVGPLDYTSLLSTFNAAKGGALPVLWTPPPPDDGAAIPVRFLSGGTLKTRHHPGGQAYTEVELEEVV